MKKNSSPKTQSYTLTKRLSSINPIFWILLAGIIIGLYNIQYFELRYSDEGHFFAEASALAGEPYKNGIEVLSSFKPLFIGILALLIKIFGLTPIPLLILNILLGTVTVYATYQIGRRLLDERAGLIAAGILTLTKLHITFAKSTLSDTMMNLFLTLAILSLIISWKKNNAHYLMLTGAIASLAFHTKPLGIMAILLVCALRICNTFLPKTFERKDIIPHTIKTLKDLALILAGFLIILTAFTIIYALLGYHLIDQHLFYVTSAIGRFPFGETIIQHTPFLNEISRIASDQFPGGNIKNQLMYIYYFLVTTSYTIIIAATAGFIYILHHLKKRAAFRFILAWTLLTIILLIGIGYGVPRVLLTTAPLVSLIAATSSNAAGSLPRLKSRTFKAILVIATILTLVDASAVITYTPGYGDLFDELKEAGTKMTISNNPNIAAFYMQSDSELPANITRYRALIDQGYTTFVYFSWYDNRIQDPELREILTTKLMTEPAYTVKYEVEDWRIADELHGIMKMLESNSPPAISKYAGRISELIETDTTTQTVKVYDLSS